MDRSFSAERNRVIYLSWTIFLHLKGAVMQAKQIAPARRGLGWTQARLATEAGLHPKAVAYWERKGGATTPHWLHANAGLNRIQAALCRHGVTFGPDHVTISNQ